MEVKLDMSRDEIVKKLSNLMIGIFTSEEYVFKMREILYFSFPSIINKCIFYFVHYETMVDNMINHFCYVIATHKYLIYLNCEDMSYISLCFGILLFRTACFSFCLPSCLQLDFILKYLFTSFLCKMPCRNIKRIN